MNELFVLCEDDFQDIARSRIGRELSSSELDEVAMILNESIPWADHVGSAIHEVVGDDNKPS